MDGLCFLSGYPLKFCLLIYRQSAERTVFGCHDVAASARNTGISFHNRFVFVRAAEEKSRIGPSCGIVN
jgi:hypothetical protein